MEIVQIFALIAVIIIGLCVLLVGLSFIAGYVMYCTVIKRPKKTSEETPFPVLMGAYYKDLGKFVNEQRELFEKLPHQVVKVKTADGLMLEGYFIPADKPCGKTVLLAHGYNSYGYREFGGQGQFLHEKGINLLVANHRAHANSEGKYIGFGILDRRDMFLWLDEIAKLAPNDDVYLYGVSMGGATVLMMSEFKLPEKVKGIIADCAFTTPYEVFARQAKFLFHLPAFPIIPIAEMFCKRKVGYGFKDADTRIALQNIKVPLLLIHGKSDVFILPKMSEQNFSAAACKDKKLVLIEGAGHAGSYFINTKQYQTELSNFLFKEKEM